MGEFGYFEIVWGRTARESDSRENHVWERHGLTMEDVEEALLDDAPRHWPNRSDQPSNRRRAVGWTNGGRCLEIVLEATDQDDVWRVITAWPAGPEQIQLHRRVTGGRRR